MSNSVEKFLLLGSEKRFQGWSTVGEPTLGEKIPFFGQTLNYTLLTGNGEESYTSIIRHFGWVVVFGVTEVDGVPHVITLVQWKPGVNCASWELLLVSCHPRQPLRRFSRGRARSISRKLGLAEDNFNTSVAP